MKNKNTPLFVAILALLFAALALWQARLRITANQDEPITMAGGSLHMFSSRWTNASGAYTYKPTNQVYGVKFACDVNNNNLEQFTAQGDFVIEVGFGPSEVFTLAYTKTTNTITASLTKAKPHLLEFFLLTGSHPKSNWKVDTVTSKELRDKDGNTLNCSQAEDFYLKFY